VSGGRVDDKRIAKEIAPRIEAIRVRQRWQVELRVSVKLWFPIFVDVFIVYFSMRKIFSRTLNT
jgi:hypothetical protein